MKDRKERFGGKFTADIELKNEEIAKPIKIFAWIFGVVGFFIFGGGMSIALTNAASVVSLVIGSLVGCAGIAMMIANSFIYKAIVIKIIYNREMRRLEEAEKQDAEKSGVIEVKNLTHNYGHFRGVFDVSFSVKKGEVFGFLGPNGAGKSTTMRHLMGYSEPQNGNCYINGLDCWKNHAKLMSDVGYLPGEVALPEGVSGKGFLDMMRGMRKGKADRTEELIKTFDVNTESSVKRMSIGEKRKLAVAAAFMNDPDVLLLDEPTSGLDPVMQETFIDFVRKEKEKGKTVLLSSHIFSEVEALCDRIAIIKEGKIVSVISADEVKHFKRKTFAVTFADKACYDKFNKEDFDFRERNEETNTVEIAVDDAQCGKMVKTLTNYNVENLVEHQQTLEEYFMHFYKSDRTFGGLGNG